MIPTDTDTTMVSDQMISKPPAFIMPNKIDKVQNLKTKKLLMYVGIGVGVLLLLNLLIKKRK